MYFDGIIYHSLISKFNGVDLKFINNKSLLIFHEFLGLSHGRKFATCHVICFCTNNGVVEI